MDRQGTMTITRRAMLTAIGAVLVVPKALGRLLGHKPKQAKDITAVEIEYWSDRLQKETKAAWHGPAIGSIEFQKWTLRDGDRTLEGSGGYMTFGKGVRIEYQANDEKHVDVFDLVVKARTDHG